MSYQIGTQNLSPVQKRYLSDIKDASANVKLRILLQILTDEDITSGKEMIHPDWISYYQEDKEALRGILPKRDFDTIDRNFAELELDKTIAKIDPASERITFLLGAGASNPAPSGIPTVKDLLPDLLIRARRLDRPDLQKLADFCENSKIDNIEDLMTATQLSEFCSRNPSVLKLVEFLLYRKEAETDEIYFRRAGRPASTADLSAVAFLQDTLQLLFGLLSSRMLPAQPNAGHSAIAMYVRNNPGSAIVTTNYDCCMDLALQESSVVFSYLVEFANQKEKAHQKNEIVSLIKLHGSLNWFYCGTCQQVNQINFGKTVEEYLRDENTYSVIAVCKECGGQRRGLLVPPLAMKFDASPPLTPLIEKAQDNFSKADLIVVVGFSFAEADMYISRMLTKSMQRNEKVRVIVFDPDFDVVQKLRRQLSLRITDFDQGRIIQVHGDCSITLPKFLSGEYKDAPSAKNNSTEIKRKSKKVTAASA